MSGPPAAPDRVAHSSDGEVGKSEKTQRVTIVLPCLNEGAGLIWIATQLESAFIAFPHLRLTALFVDDGSTDDTWAVIEELANRDGSRVRGVRLHGRHGKAAAQAAGIRAALRTSDFVAVMDSDGQHDVTLLPPMICRSVETGTPVIAARQGYRRGVLPSVGTAGLNLLSRILGVRFDPSLSEFMVLPTPTASALASAPRLGLLPLVALVQALRVDYEEHWIKVLPRNGANPGTRWKLADLWHKAIMHLLVDPWSLLPRITLWIAGLVVVLGGYGLTVGVLSVAQGTFLGIGSVLVAVVTVFAALAGLMCVTLGVAVVSYQTSAGLTAQPKVQEETG